MKKRGFEIISKYLNNDIHLPVRKTSYSAGYDFEASEDIIIPSIWKKMAEKVFIDKAGPLKATLIPTGVKAYMLEDEYLQLSVRSGIALKTGLMLANSVGIVDADYYNNPDNEGHIMFPVHNFGFMDKLIKKGDRIGQGIFLKFLKVDNDDVHSIRQGGFGSTESIGIGKTDVSKTYDDGKLVANG